MFVQPRDQQLNDYLSETNISPAIDNADLDKIKPLQGNFTTTMMAQGEIPFTHGETLASPQAPGSGPYIWPLQQQIQPQQMGGGYSYQPLVQPVNYDSYQYQNTMSTGFTGPQVPGPQSSPLYQNSIPFQTNKRKRGDSVRQSQRPMPSIGPGRLSMGQGPVRDDKNRVQKLRASHSPTMISFIVEGSAGKEYHKLLQFLGDKSIPVDHQPCRVAFDDLERFFRDLNEERNRSASRGPAGQTMQVHSITHESPDIVLSPRDARQNKLAIARQYAGYQKEFRLNDSAVEGRFKCTLGCSWSHKMKSNWERHERTHYPQEIWLCKNRECRGSSIKQRVSFRKDLARRHHSAHHKSPGDPLLTDMELDDLIVKIPDSLYPRDCVFEGCSKKFSSWDERSSHVEQHLKKGDTLLRESIEKYTIEKPIVQGLEDNAEHEHDEDSKSRLHENDDADHEADNVDDDDDEDDGDDGPDHEGNRYKDQDDDETGAGGQPGNLPGILGSSTSGIGGWTGTGNGQQGQRDYGYSSYNNYNNYSSASNFDTFGGSGFIPPVDKRPWKSLMSLRLQLLPQVFARGIAQTPLVLRKIQLQAVLALEASSVRKNQMIKILRREISIMAAALPLSYGRNVNGFPRYAAMTKLLSGLRKADQMYNTTFIATQDKTIERFSGLEEALLTEKDDIVYGDKDDTHNSLCTPFCSFDGGHIYQCLRVQPSRTPITPSRLIHVGSKTKPMLHLDTSEVLPGQVNYCCLSHCWDDGCALSLSMDNMASLQHEIPADRLTQSFHLAINIARDRGVEYVWIDTLCIVQDSHEDLITEASRITQIHQSATFSIVITSVAFAKEVTKSKEELGYDEKAEESWADANAQRSWHHDRRASGKSMASTISETPELTVGPSAVDTISTKPTQITDNCIPEIQESVIPLPIRRSSHQLESFLSEPTKLSYFHHVQTLGKPSQSLPSRQVSLSLRTKQSTRCPTLDSEPCATPSLSPSSTTKSLSKIATYLDTWHRHWQRLSSKSAGSSPVTSREPSISDLSFRSEKKKGVLSFPGAWEKLFKPLRRKDIHDFEIGYESREPDG